MGYNLQMQMVFLYKYLELGGTLITLIIFLFCFVLFALHALESLLYMVPSVVMTYTYWFCVWPLMMCFPGLQF